MHIIIIISIKPNMSVVRFIYSDCLVKVRAQVMTRDESTEGWLPLAGGGLANVSIRKRARLPPEVGGHEYIIYGQRISDQTVSLRGLIFFYNYFWDHIVNPVMMTHSFSSQHLKCLQYSKSWN